MNPEGDMAADSCEDLWDLEGVCPVHCWVEFVGERRG